MQSRDEDQPAAWPETGRRELLTTPIYRIDEHLRTSPRTGRTHPLYVMHAPDWVNVIPLTSDCRVVLVRQYRHGTRELTLEIPGGVIDADDTDPAAAAARELLEETGYRAGRIEPIGDVAPNPAIIANRCHTYVATDLQRVAEPRLDGKEDISVVELPLREVIERIRRGEVCHALVIVAFAWYLLRCSPDLAAGR